MDDVIVEDFFKAIYKYIEYWESQQDYSRREVLTNLSHSILYALDGCCLEFPGDIEDLASATRNMTLNDRFLEYLECME